MSGQASAREQKELQLLLAKDKKLQNIHTLFFLPPNLLGPAGIVAEQAYLKHLAKMKKLMKMKD